MTRLILSLLIATFITGPARALIINVPEQYNTIQEAIDLSADGDTVLVQAGDYYECINFNGHNIVLASRYILTNNFNDVENTRINGFPNDCSLITLESGEDSTSAILGLTLTFGKGEYGGAIHCDGAGPTIAYNYIWHNGYIHEEWTTYSVYGGGIYCINSNATIHNNIIKDNWVSFSETEMWGRGAGICCINSNITIRDNIFQGNLAGGLEGGYGGGIYSDSCSPNIHNNIFYGNRAGQGSGVYWGDTGLPFCFNNNTVYGNHWFEAYGEPSYAVYGITPPEFVITNCIIWGNVPYGLFINCGGGQARYCDLQDSIPGDGNIYVDPLFADTANGDFHLQSNGCSFAQNSPCIDAGHPDSLDIRLGCFWGLGTSRCDMGAYGGWTGMVGCNYVPGDANGNGQVNGLDVIALVNFFKGGNPPADSCYCGSRGYIPSAADANGNCSLSGLDVTYSVNYLKGMGPEPTACTQCPWLGGQ